MALEMRNVSIEKESSVITTNTKEQNRVLVI
jgi:hypothetical protein